MPSGDASRTVNFWIQTTGDDTSTTHPIFRYGVNGSGNGKDCAAYLAATSAEIRFNAEGVSISPGGTYADGDWHMVTLTVTNTGLGLPTWSSYLDGIAGESVANVGTATVLNSFLYIGVQTGKPGFGRGR